MTTIPARLSKVSQVSSSLAHAQSRSRSLYRAFYRAICALYPLDVPPAMLRAKMRTMFEKNRHVKDVAVLDVLLLKGHQEYQETMNAWKQTPHVMKWFTEEEVRTWFVCYLESLHTARPQGFLNKFYATRDEGRGPTHEGL